MLEARELGSQRRELWSSMILAQKKRKTGTRSTGGEDDGVLTAPTEEREVEVDGEKVPMLSSGIKTRNSKEVETELGKEVRTEMSEEMEREVK